MKSGNIIEYMDDGNIVLGYILSVESVSAAGRKKENFRIVTEKNKITNITASKIINCEQSHISEKTNQAAIASRLIEMRERRRQMAQSVPLAEIRELIMLESQQAFGAREIAAAYYGANFTNDEASAVVRNIFVKNPYFKRKEDYFFPASDEDVARFLEQQEKELLQKRQQEEFARDVADLESSGYASDACELFVKKHPQKIELLKNSILFEDNAAYVSKAKELQQTISELINRKVEIFDFLVRLKIFSRHENFAARRFNFSREFGAPVLDEASRIASGSNSDRFVPAAAEEFLNAAFGPGARPDFKFDFSGGRRIDLRGAAAITIDSEYTQCCDDAVSLFKYNGKDILIIHVSDASEFIAEGSVLDRAANERASAIYLAEGKIDILPERITNDFLSLREGEERASFSLFIECVESGAAPVWFFAPTLIKISKKCSYDEIDEVYEKLSRGENISHAGFASEELRAILCAAEKFRNEREIKGALNLSFPKSEVYVEKFDEVSPEIKLMSETHGQSGVIVSEFMILYNSLSASLLATAGACGCFKSSKPYPEPQLIESYRKKLAETGQSYDAALAWAIRRNMQFAETSYAPSAHGMLGTPCYVQSSSPLRRYIDLLNQRQIKSLVIEGRPFYEEDAVRKISQYLDATLASISEAEQESHYYWLYLYLKQNAGRVYEGVVLEASEERARIEIAGVFLHVTAQARIHGRFSVGEKVSITVENADARARKIFFKASPVDR